MAQFAFDEVEQEHLYESLLAGGEQWNGIKKKYAKMGKDEVPDVEEALAINARLRQRLNPRAAEEALERDRAKRDPAQLDMEQDAAQTETGGSTKVRLQTEPQMNEDDMQRALFDLGQVVPHGVLCDWSDEELCAVEEYIGKVLAAKLVGDAFPDEPDALAQVGVSVAKVDERLAIGPFIVQVIDSEGDNDFEVVNRDTKEVRQAFDGELDAKFFAAQWNLEKLRLSDMTEEEQNRWAAAGPWGVVLEPVPTGDDSTDGSHLQSVDEYFIVAGDQREKCASNDDAFGRAARYNRSIAERAAAAEWNDPVPPKVDDTAVQENQVAIEHAENAASQPEADHTPPEGDREEPALKEFMDQATGETPAPPADDISARRATKKGKK